MSSHMKRQAGRQAGSHADDRSISKSGGLTLISVCTSRIILGILDGNLCRNKEASKETSGCHPAIQRGENRKEGI